MHTWYWIVLLKPFLAFIFLALFVAPFVVAFDRLIPAGPLKRALWRDVTTAAAPLRVRVLVTVGMLTVYACAIGYAAWVNSPS